MILTVATVIPLICLSFSTIAQGEDGETQLVGNGALRFFRNGEEDDNRETNWRSGIVQIYINGEWSNICMDSNFGRNEADVICRQLTYTRASTDEPFNSSANSQWGTDPSPNHVRELSCESTDITVTQCTFNTQTSTTPQCMDNANDVVVTCNPQQLYFDSPSAGNVRLRDGLYSNDGLLEVHCDDFWGTVCIQGFSTNAALLACGQLGYNSFKSYNRNTLDPQEDSVPIWYDADRPLTNCEFPPMGQDFCLTRCNQCPNDVSGMSNSCSHTDDVTIICEYNSTFPRSRSTTSTINECLLLNPENTDGPDTTGGRTTTSPSPSTSPLDISTGELATGVIIGAVAGGVGGLIIIVVLIVAVFVFLCVVMRYRNNRSPTPRIMKSAGSSEDNLATTRSNEYIQPPFIELKDVSNDQLSGILLPSLIKPDNLKLIEKIGQGEFGLVYRGLLTVYEKTDAQVTSVAIKTLKGSYTKTQTDELIQEAEKMTQFDHLNVLSLTGVCVGLLESPCIVMPFMSNGSLLSYLRKEAADLTVSDTSDENLKLDTTKQLLSMCLQVAKGMAYLTEHKFVHRDLAARNCMISADGVIKVADFGLAEDVYTTEYFKQDRSAEESVKLPLKWMALESIHYGKFSEKSDVWSFGVLCWEVFSVGKSPYPGLSPSEVVEMLDSGRRLSKPSNAACCEKSYELILTCWEKSPDKRPHFFELVERIEQLLAPLADYVDFTSNFARKLSS